MSLFNFDQFRPISTNFSQFWPILAGRPVKIHFGRLFSNHVLTENILLLFSHSELPSQHRNPRIWNNEVTRTNHRSGWWWQQIMSQCCNVCSSGFLRAVRASGHRLGGSGVLARADTVDWRDGTSDHHSLGFFNFDTDTCESCNCGLPIEWNTTIAFSV